jgi:hypothetical protein
MNYYHNMETKVWRRLLQALSFILPSVASFAHAHPHTQAGIQLTQKRGVKGGRGREMKKKTPRRESRGVLSFEGVWVCGWRVFHGLVGASNTVVCYARRATMLEQTHTKAPGFNPCEAAK